MAVGTPDQNADNATTNCVTIRAIAQEGARTRRVSYFGVDDMVGNVADVCPPPWYEAART